MFLIIIFIIIIFRYCESPVSTIESPSMSFLLLSSPSSSTSHLSRFLLIKQYWMSLPVPILLFHTSSPMMWQSWGKKRILFGTNIISSFVDFIFIISSYYQNWCRLIFTCIIPGTALCYFTCIIPGTALCYFNTRILRGIKWVFTNSIWFQIDPISQVSSGLTVVGNKFSHKLIS